MASRSARSQARALVDDVEQRFVDFADVVKQRDTLDLVLHRFVGAIGGGEDERVPCNPAHMCARPLIGRVDRVEQRLGQCRRESFGTSTPASLARQQRRAEGGRRRSKRRQGPIGRFGIGIGLRHAED